LVTIIVPLLVLLSHTRPPHSYFLLISCSLTDIMSAITEEDGFKILTAQKCFNGTIIRFEHMSKETKCVMTASLYLPPGSDIASAAAAKKVPLLVYLSGLTCTDENVIQKSGALRVASEEKIAFLAPDTSPRNVNIPGEDDSWDFGSGAGFYVDATEEPWSRNYRMYSYVVVELDEVLQKHFPQIDITHKGIMGHSMGGHGALTIALKNQESYRSVSAVAPICNPIGCPWGEKAFTGYLGADNKEAWENYDACKLMEKLGKSKYETILLDFGRSDNFLWNQLMPYQFSNICNDNDQEVSVRIHDGYDHSYFFVASFIEDHIRFHAETLKSTHHVVRKRPKSPHTHATSIY
jgi:S-formylglutathione hydrolase